MSGSTLTVNLKPTYDVGYWEYVYEMEQKPYLKLFERKALYLKKLEEIDLFSVPEDNAMKINKQIKSLNDELNILYGMKLFMDEMKNCYLDSSIKIYNTYHYKNLQMEMENHKLRQNFINESNAGLYLKIATESCEDVQTLKNKIG